MPIYPPAGLVINRLPPEYDKYQHRGATLLLSGSSFYRRVEVDGQNYFQTVDPPPGVVFDELPDIWLEANVGGRTYYQVDRVFFEKQRRDGRDVYVIVASPV